MPKLTNDEIQSMTPAEILAYGGRESVAHHNAMTATNDEALAYLEGLVDRRHGGFHSIVVLLAEVARSKAGHLDEVWQDRIASDRYDALADKLDAFAEQINLI